MSTFKHTPGPWLRIGTTVYALMHAGWKRGVEQFKNRFTVQVQRDRECSEEEAEANARLIAAAPELLEALKVARQFVHDGSFQIGWNIDRIDAAIAKATGAQQ
jgi:hypothetical protein